jgi:hypothetical protein
VGGQGSGQVDVGMSEQGGWAGKEVSKPGSVQADKGLSKRLRASRWMSEGVGRQGGQAGWEDEGVSEPGSGWADKGLSKRTRAGRWMREWAGG